MTYPKSHDQIICVPSEHASYLGHPDNFPERLALDYLLKGKPSYHDTYCEVTCLGTGVTNL